MFEKDVSLRVQVPNTHIFTQRLYYNYYYPKPKYLINRYLDPLGIVLTQRLTLRSSYLTIQKNVPAFCSKPPLVLQDFVRTDLQEVSFSRTSGIRISAWKDIADLETATGLGAL